jgi:hypothetical protein
MNRKDHVDDKRRLEQIKQDLETQLLTPEQERELELQSAKLSRSVQQAVVMGRVKAALAGALAGAVLAVLYNAFIADPDTAPVSDTTVGWVAFYVGLCVPWALIGALVGALLGWRKQG